MALTIIARILSVATSVYSLLCAIRVFMTWMPTTRRGKGGQWLARATDPYLGLFSRISMFHTDRVDFSPIAALTVLSVASNAFSTLASTGQITIGFLFSLLLQAAWSAVAFMLSFYAVCAIIRLIGNALHLGNLNPFWNILDAILNPILYRINRNIYRHKAISYTQGLITGVIVLILLRAAGGALIRLLSSLLLSLPF
ncbi:MAG: YggT family protein [Spirochaetaceae bacterium]|nr:YggT family protein [Spirochaetaceae bacterium]